MKSCSLIEYSQFNSKLLETSYMFSITIFKYCNISIIILLEDYYDGGFIQIIDETIPKKSEEKAFNINNSPATVRPESFASNKASTLPEWDQSHIDLAKTTLPPESLTVTADLDAKTRENAPILTPGVTVDVSNDMEVVCEVGYLWYPEKRLCLHMKAGCPRGMYLSVKQNMCLPRRGKATSCLPGFEFRDDINECTGMLA